jgi:two-component system, LuxR family, sensor kinase FixL
VLRMPFVVTFSFLGVVLVMGLELSRDVLRAAELMRELQRSEQQLTLAAAAGEDFALGVGPRERPDLGQHRGPHALRCPKPRSPSTSDRFAATLHAPDRPVMERAVEAALAGPEPFAADYRVDLPDGSLRWISARGKVERDSKGRPLRMRGISIDITGSKEAELESALHRQELAHLSRVSVLGELAGTLAHELNQPLAAILGNAQVGRRMMDQDPPDLEGRSPPSSTTSRGTRNEPAASSTACARCSARTPSPKPTRSISTKPSIRCWPCFTAKSSAAVRRIQLHPGVGLPSAAAGRVEVQQVMINLVLNGLDAMQGAARENLLEIATCQDGGHLHLIVRDHGPGIPAETMPRLFEPFVTTKPGGLGLGLAISRGIAERFRGELNAENHPEGGAVFRLTLPALPG